MSGGSNFYFYFSLNMGSTNVLKIGPVAESEKLPIHGSLVGPVVEPWLNR